MDKRVKAQRSQTMLENLKDITAFDAIRKQLKDTTRNNKNKTRKQTYCQEKNK